MSRVIPSSKPGAELAVRRPRIAIALPTHDFVPVKFAYDLANMLAATVAHVPDGTQIGMTMVQGTYVHTARQQLIEELIQQEVTHVLWIDTDMSFPPDALIRLMEHGKQVVGINYSTRGMPPDYVAIKKVGVPGEKCVTLPDSTGLEEVEAMGFGLVLMRMDALKNLPDPGELPWFRFEWMKDHRRWMGEDVVFCKLLREAGVKLYVDHDLSLQCGHIGSFDYRLEAVAGWKADEEQK